MVDLASELFWQLALASNWFGLQCPLHWGQIGRVRYISQFFQNNKIPVSFLCQYSMTNDMACPSAEESYILFAFCAMPQPSQMRADFLFLFNNTSGIFCVCSFECLLNTITPESQDSVLGPFSKIRGGAKAVLGAHALQLSSRSDQNHRCRFARQPLMGDLMVMLRLKLCNSSCLGSRCTPKK